MSALDTPEPSDPGAAAPTSPARRTSADLSSRTLSVAASGTALVMAVFAAFVVNVGDSIRSFHAGVAGEAWGLSGMSLGLAVSLLTAGALADDLGHRRVLRCSAGLLAGASALGGLAPSMEILVAARVLQGVAGGGILAAGLGSIGRAFPSGRARTRATGVWGAALGAGVMAGPLGAAGLSAVIGWRGGFWVEAAAAAALMMAAARLSESRAPARRSLDLPGITTLAAGMTLLTAALVETRHGWFAGPTLALFAAATLMLAAFASVELRSRNPMLDPHLVAKPQFLASISGALFTGLAVVGLMSYAPALMQQSLHISVIGSAAVLAAWSATSMVVALAAGSLPSRLPAQTRLLIGLALAAVGELALAGLGTGTSWTRLVPGLFITGLGSGIVNAALGRIAVESVPPGRAGMGSGASNTARYLGGAAGAALIVSIASAGGAHGLIGGWNTAALISAGLCALGVATVASCRAWTRRDARHRRPTPNVPCASRAPSERLMHLKARQIRPMATADPISRRPYDLATRLTRRPAATLRTRLSRRASPAYRRSTCRKASAIITPRCRPAHRNAWASGCPTRCSSDTPTPGTAARVPELRHMSAHGGTRASSAVAAEALVLANRAPIALRQLGAADRAGLADLFSRLSPESRRRRFFAPKLELTPRELTFFTDIDHLNHEAVAAIDRRDNSIVGVARYVRHIDRPEAAELGIEVADAFQRMGIGTALTSLTIHHANANGMRYLTATTMWENSAARKLLRNHGFRARRSRSGEIEHELKLEQSSPREIPDPAEQPRK